MSLLHLQIAVLRRAIYSFRPSQQYSETTLDFANSIHLKATHSKIRYQSALHKLLYQRSVNLSTPHLLSLPYPEATGRACKQSPSPLNQKDLQESNPTYLPHISLDKQGYALFQTCAALSSTVSLSTYCRRTATFQPNF